MAHEKGLPTVSVTNRSVGSPLFTPCHDSRCISLKSDGLSANKKRLCAVFLNGFPAFWADVLSLIHLNVLCRMLAKYATWDIFAENDSVSIDEDLNLVVRLDIIPLAQLHWDNDSPQLIQLADDSEWPHPGSPFLVVCPYLISL